MAGVSLPVRMEGPVIVGFGRGSSLLGFPTANIPTEQYDQLLPDFKVGVYYGWATLNGVEPVYEMAMSIGYNPHFKNEKKTIEVHLLHKFEDNFYGAHLRIVVVGFIREMRSYPSLAALKDAIAEDCAKATASLQSQDSISLRNDPFLFA
ncbi:riboflavin kinase [Pelomyxa schiedti]|nr:riboflavin kinase [Pelomyxa schiedti]KAH3746229.1 riboflavin kinase [Pelomyxa schiedti]